jgi:uncharacterized protein (DUF1697 family)
MARYVAFLRGMNLGGRRIANEELRAHFEALGCDEVATFRASGNVIFASAAKSPAELSGALEAGLGERLGYEVPVYLRSGAAVAAIAAHQPFGPAPTAASVGKLQVALLLDEPTASAREEALSLATDADLLAIEGRELYWLPAGRMSDSELDLKAIAAILGPTTIRTKGTIDQIAARHLG